jgi:hypothetical protein
MYIFSCIKFTRNHSIYRSWSSWSCMFLIITMNMLSVPYGIGYLMTVRKSIVRRVAACLICVPLSNREGCGRTNQCWPHYSKCCSTGETILPLRECLPLEWVRLHLF